jgi:hypothetical protein
MEAVQAIAGVGSMTDPQAMAIVIQESRTSPMTCDELSVIFRLGYRRMKSYLDDIGNVERVGSFYRVPIGHMPAEWIAAKLANGQILADSCNLPTTAAGRHIVQTSNGVFNEVDQWQDTTK